MSIKSLSARRPIRRSRAALLPVLAIVANCTGAADPLLHPNPLGPNSLRAEMIYSDAKTPPADGPGQCWAQTTLPAVFETDTIHKLLRPAEPGGNGHPGRAAIYQTVTRQRMVSDQAHVWFRTPCAAEMTPDFIASLQRALIARGYFTAPLTGTMDRATRRALRRYQAQLGLDSATLALGTARILGLARYHLTSAERRDQG